MAGNWWQWLDQSSWRGGRLVQSQWHADRLHGRPRGPQTLLRQTAPPAPKHQQAPAVSISDLSKNYVKELCHILTCLGDGRMSKYAIAMVPSLYAARHLSELSHTQDPRRIRAVTLCCMYPFVAHMASLYAACPCLYAHHSGMLLYAAQTCNLPVLDHTCTMCSGPLASPL